MADQFFKGDAVERKYYESGKTILDQLSQQRSEFFDDAYNCFVLGDLLFSTGRAPLANAIPQNIFRESFSTIFDSFEEAGTFEAYLTVFRKIFGDDVEVEFTVPGPGQLNIDIVSSGIEILGMTVREIDGDEYDNYTLIDDEDDRIVLQGIKGFQSQYELEQMLFEMVPAGIYTEISLTIGEE